MSGGNITFIGFQILKFLIKKVRKNKKIKKLYSENQENWGK